MPFNPKSLIDNTPMTRLQYGTVIVCLIMNMIDGMDVTLIAYTAPAIAKAWTIGPQALGVVFSAGLIGMTVGTLLVAPLGDRIGRKNLILISAGIIGICIYITAYSTSINMLLIFRFLSGIGIGSMLANTAALTAEYTPDKTKDFWVSFIVGGYPLGAVIAGLVSARVIPIHGWERMFIYAGLSSLITLPLILFFLSESMDYYIKHQPLNALSKVNSILQKMKHSTIDQLPQRINKQAVLPINKLLSSEYKIPSIQLWIAMFMALAAVYFLTSWIPKLATNAGLPMQLAIYAGTVFNLGALFGIITQGYLSSRFGLKKTIGVFLIITSVLMASFGLFIGSSLLLLLVGLLGFGIQGGWVGLYACAARMYPTEFRATGIGWALSAGRVGGIVGPILGGVLIGAGLSLVNNFIVFAIPTLIAGLLTLKISSKKIS